MSGEFINTAIFDNINKGSFKAGSINDLFDVNDDGVLSEIEKDRAMNIGIEKQLESINPVIAKAYQDETFMINQGYFLTTEQKKKRDDFIKVIDNLVNKINQQEEEDNPPERFEEPQYNIEYNELDTDDLFQDLQKRRYLSEAELNNKP